MRTGLRAALAAVVAASPLSPSLAEAAKPGPLSVPVYAWIVPDGSAGERCEGPCLKAIQARVRARRGVRKAEIEGDGLKLQIVPGLFRAAEAIRGIDGMKTEMRLPFQGIELRFVASAPFPPVGFLEGTTLIVEMSEEVQGAIEKATGFRLPSRMKCLGRLDGDHANEAVLVRFESERRTPVTLIPFMAEADLDGDRRPDLFLRLAGLPELLIFNRAAGLVAVPVGKVRALEEIPRCEQGPTRFVRGIARTKIRCMGQGVPPHAGDAIERVEHNRSAELLMWSEAGFSTCEPLGEGALPPLPVKKKEDEEAGGE